MFTNYIHTDFIIFASKVVTISLNVTKRFSNIEKLLRNDHYNFKYYYALCTRGSLRLFIYW